MQDVSSLKDFFETNLDLADPECTMGVSAERAPRERWGRRLQRAPREAPARRLLLPLVLLLLVLPCAWLGTWLAPSHAAALIRRRRCCTLAHSLAALPTPNECWATG